MTEPPPVAIGSALYLAGAATAVATVTGGPVGIIAVAGFVGGLAGGGRLVTSPRGARLLDHRVATAALGLPLLVLGVWVTWTGLNTGGGSDYQLAIASVFGAVVGLGVFRSGDVTPSVEGEDAPVVALPRTRTGASVQPTGRRHILRMVVLVVVLPILVALAYASVTGSVPFWGLATFVLLSGYTLGDKSRIQLHDTGVVGTRYIYWLVPVGRAVTPWEAIYGYEVTDGRLRIATSVGRDFVYDSSRIGDIDRVVEILDDHIPRL